MGQNGTYWFPEKGDDLVNRFILVVLVVAGVFGLPYLLWVATPNSSVTASDRVKDDLENHQGIDWYFKHEKYADSDDATIELDIVSGSVNEQRWREATTSEQLNKLLLIQPIDWLGVQDELLTREIEDFTGVRFTGWIMRYFEDLSASNPDIPDSTKELVEGNWEYEGSGYIFTNERIEQTVVIESEEVYQHGDSNDWVESDYRGWIQIVTTPIEEDVSFWFALPESIHQQLPVELTEGLVPAIVQREHPEIQSVYMAADYQSLESPPALYQIFGLSSVYNFFYANRGDGFYWSTFTSQLTNMVASAKDLSGVSVRKNEELVNHSRISGDQFEVQVDGDWQEMSVKGVNIGMGKPGFFPGEAAITEEEYYRWFQQIGEMNANTIRVYTVHPPGFYRALKRYNEEHDVPLYVFHGAWTEEELLEETQNAFNEETNKRFIKEYQDIVDVIHGNARILPQVGHASGTYEADISEYVVGWIIGIEWYPEMVVGTNEENDHLKDYDGQFVKTENASPFEHWLAMHMDGILTYEADNYNELRPISFTNWVTTDLLDHPSEPNIDEDLVSVNPNVIRLKNEMEPIGQFASYHVYPYYPDFLNVDKEYLEYVDQDGEKNSYAGYLNDLRAAHDMPVLIAEFGIPASRGGTHINPYGWNQGNVTEQQQGDYVSKLFRTIIAEDYLGGLVFSWQDEWFKRTWNTQEYDNRERRPYWSNRQTNEQNFGLLSFDSMRVQVDGSFEDWTEVDDFTGDSSASLKVTHDEANLYLKIEGLQDTERARIVLDTIPDQGNTGIDALSFEDGIDFIVDMNGEESRLVADTYYDYYHYLYGNDQKMIEPVSDGRKNTGKFTPIYYVLNKKLYYPELDEVRPFEFYETGKLTRGNGNPDSADYNSLADYEFGDNSVEIRIPWLLLQFRDPSRLEVIGDVFKDGEEASEFIESIGIGLVMGEAEGTKVVSEDGGLRRYSWESWNTPTSKERLKESYYILQQTFADLE